MSASAKRQDKRGIATRAALIESAERLFAERGIEGASLRELGVAIGAANVNVVHYHFGSKEALIAATVAFRLPDIDHRRAELLAATHSSDEKIGIGQYLDVLFRPLFEQTNGEGRRSYIAFLHSLHRANSLSLFVAPSPDYPTTLLVTDKLRSLSGMPADIFARRLQIVFAIIAAAIGLIDSGADTAEEQAAKFSEALIMAEAALTISIHQN